MIKDQIVNPFLIEEDVVSIALMDDPLFEQDLMNANLDQSDEKEFEMAESIIPDSDEFDSPLLDDSLCGDSIDAMDMEVDEYIDSINSISDEDEELIDMALGLPPM